ncbi:MAG: hypothetical protein QXO84_02395 [Candidatus Aenigmatarchaeota archaeon]
MRKSQVATEYLTIAVLSLTILIPLITYINDLYVSYRDESNINLAKNSVSKMVKLSDWVCTQGEPARVNTMIYIPNNLEKIVFLNKTIVFKIKTKSGVVDISESSTCNINGSLPLFEGYYKVEIIAENDGVRLTVI